MRPYVALPSSSVPACAKSQRQLYPQVLTVFYWSFRGLQAFCRWRRSRPRARAASCAARRPGSPCAAPPGRPRRRRWRRRPAARRCAGRSASSADFEPPAKHTSTRVPATGSQVGARLAVRVEDERDVGVRAARRSRRAGRSASGAGPRARPASIDREERVQHVVAVDDVGVVSGHRAQAPRWRRAS